MSPIYRESALPLDKMQLNYFGLHFLRLKSCTTIQNLHKLSLCGSRSRESILQINFTCYSRQIKSKLYFSAVSGGTCEDPGTPEFGIRTVSDVNFRHASTVEYMCQFGYTLQGQNVIICASNGLWNAQRPTCVPGSYLRELGTVHY